MAWLGIKRSAKYLGISENDFRRLFAEGEIVGHRRELPWRPGARWKFNTEDLDRWQMGGESSDESALLRCNA